MVTRLLTLLSVAVAVALTDAQDPARCFECTDIPDPADCTIITTCATGQKCVVEQYISSGGLVLYKTGCESQARCNARKKRSLPRRSSLLSRRDDILTCDECCDGDFCNDQGCAQIALKQPARGPLCFKCDYENDPKNCRHLMTCQIGDICMLQELHQRAPDGSAIYKSSCIRPQQCNAYALIGKKKRNTYCHVCCPDDYCNDRCDELITPAPTTPSTPPTTTTIPTTTTTTTTTPAPTTTTTTKRPTTTTTTTTTTTPKPTTTHRVTPQEQCQHHRGYHYDMNSHLCYKFHYEQKTWDQGNHMCKNEGGTLAIIDTEAKWNYLRDRLRHDSQLHQNIYIGGRDTNSKDDRYYWTNGERLTFTAWHRGQPDRGSDDSIKRFYIGGRQTGQGDTKYYWPNGDLVIFAVLHPKKPNGGGDYCIYLNQWENYDWHDYLCNEHIFFICTIDTQ